MKRWVAVLLTTIHFLIGGTLHAQTLAQYGENSFSIADIDALLSRDVRAKLSGSRFTSAEQAREILRALVVIAIAKDKGGDLLALTSDERHKLRLFTNKKSMESLMEISDERVEAEFEQNPQKYDARIREAYDAAADKFQTPSRRRAAHILIRVGKRSLTEATHLADTIVKRAREGEDFGVLAQIYSEDEKSSGAGGLLGEFADVKSSDHPIVVALYRTVSVGGVSDPVLSRSGIHVVKMLEELPARRATLKEATPAIRSTLLTQLKTTERQKWSTLLRENAEKTTFNADEIAKYVAPADSALPEKLRAALKEVGAINDARSTVVGVTTEQ